MDIKYTVFISASMDKVPTFKLKKHKYVVLIMFKKKNFMNIYCQHL